MRPSLVRPLALLPLAAAVLLAGCGRRPRGGAAGDGPARRGPAAIAEPRAIYRQMGLLAADGPLPFVGRVAFLAGQRPDSTLMLVSLSMASRALTFVREADRFRAGYEVRVELTRDSVVVHRLTAQEVVRVAAFKETQRGDESVLFSQALRVAPGRYTVQVAVRDIAGSKSGAQDVVLTVPALGGGRPGLSTPLPVFDATPRTAADSVPRLVATARATFTFGRDSTVPIYLESYGPVAPVVLAARGDGGSSLWSDTVSLTRRGEGFASAVVRVPVERLGIGVVALTATRADAPADTGRAPLFVSFGEELPVASFDDMLNYLRYFASAQRLDELRKAPPAGRAGVWAAFLRETDPNPATAQHEALSTYFDRVQQANDRYREEGQPGWLTDRGMVYVTLGDPDQLYEQGSNDVSQRGRAQVWEYRQYRVQLIFVDNSGFGRWRLTNSSEAEFQQAARRVQVR